MGLLKPGSLAARLKKRAISTRPSRTGAVHTSEVQKPAEPSLTLIGESPDSEDSGKLVRRQKRLGKKVDNSGEVEAPKQRRLNLPYEA